MDPVPTDEELSGYYAQDYYSYQPVLQESPLKRLAKRFLISSIVTHDPMIAVPGEFLDIGCGSGDYLHVMRKKGWRVRGVEPSSFGASEGTKAGLDIFNGTLLEAKFPSNSFDYVRANHSFEHVSDPVEVLLEINRILKPGGKLFIGIPNIESVPFQIFGRYWWYLGAPVHTYSYGVSNISALLHRSGFALDKIYFNSNYASLLGSLQIYANRDSYRRSSEGWLIRNPLLKVISNIVMWFIDRIRKGDAIEIIASKPA